MNHERLNSGAWIYQFKTLFIDFPVAATSPHYFARNLSMAKKISGMCPNREKHYSYAIAEPTLGIPIDQRARTQSNLVIPKLNGFSEDIQRFSNMILPMFWIEYVSIALAWVKICIYTKKILKKHLMIYILNEVLNNVLKFFLEVVNFKRTFR